MTDFLKVLGEMIAAVLGITIAISAPLGGVLFYSACRSADIYNAQHHTAYSCGDFFWAGDQINSQTQTVHLQ